MLRREDSRVREECNSKENKEEQRYTEKANLHAFHLRDAFPRDL